MEVGSIPIESSILGFLFIQALAYAEAVWLSLSNRSSNNQAVIFRDFFPGNFRVGNFFDEFDRNLFEMCFWCSHRRFDPRFIGNSSRLEVVQVKSLAESLPRLAVLS
jgi:hypothetical protein